MDKVEDAIVYICPKCGQAKPKHRIQNMCVDCEKAAHQRSNAKCYRNADWMEVAKENHLDLWEQQPGETILEFSIWTAYRDSYPGHRPTYAELSKRLGIGVGTISTAANRWSYQTRMQAWIRHCDDITREARYKEIINMNSEHIRMASELRDKLSKAISNIDPDTLGPKEIPTLLRLSAALEKQARLDTIEQEATLQDSFVGQENPELKKQQPPQAQSELSEIVSILLNTGALGDVAKIGVREVKTTQVVVGDSDGNYSELEVKK